MSLLCPYQINKHEYGFKTRATQTRPLKPENFLAEDKTAVSTSQVKAMTASKFLPFYFLLNSLSLSLADSSISARRPEQHQPVMCDCCLWFSSFLPDKHFTFQSAKRQNSEPLKRPLTLSLSITCLSITRTRRLQTALTQIRCSLANTWAAHLFSAGLSGALRWVSIVHGGRRPTQRGRSQSASQPVSGGQVTEWTPSYGCRGNSCSRTVVWG